MSATFVDLAGDRATLEEMLVEGGLVQPGHPFLVQPLPGGVSSNILRIDLPDGRSICVKQPLAQLKVEKEWRAPLSRVLAEMDWLQTAYSIVPAHVPRILAADRARGAFAMEYLEGMACWKSELLAGRLVPQVGIQLAGIVAQVHSVTARNPEFEHRFANDATFFAIRLEPYLVETARMHPDLARELIGLVASVQNNQLALVHGDVSPKNVLLGPNGPVLVDAECALYGDPSFDLAFLLNHMLLKSAHLLQQAKALENLFEAMARAYLERVDWEPVAEFDRRCAQLLPALLLARIDGKSPVEYLDQATRDRVRIVARSLLMQPSENLADLMPRWRVAMADAVQVTS